MSRIFLSHCSADEREAVALRQWLRDNGWDDVFLDVDPKRGLAAGERWQEALRQAADRCEAVLVLLSPAWAGSKWCLAEFLLAKSLNKRIFAVVLRDVPLGELPTELTAEWQLCRLVGEGRTDSVGFTWREAQDRMDFLAAGLMRLRDGLRRAGLDAGFFPWPPLDEPRRAPYRGLEPLESVDAAVFFGRDVEILRGLDALRGMRARQDKRLFVILGASGAGKSSFLRAGLLPRLARDEPHFLPLAPVRPERAPLTGEHGLAQALRRAQVALNLPAATPGQLRALLSEAHPAPLATLLRQLQDAAAARLSQPAEGAEPPTLVLPVDQAEELFNADAGEESRAFLRLLGGVLRADEAAAPAGAVPLVVAFTIRSDRYEPLQAAPELAGLQGVVFDDLKPMPPTRFREVITGPARRATEAGEPLALEPALVERLVEESAAGGDTLPLLGLALARLYRDYGAGGALTLDDYRDMGGLASVVRTEVEGVLAADAALRAQQLESLHAAFVPWLATINPANDQPMRRVARLADLPPDSHALVGALAQKRLLLMDRRGDDTVVEVAHEALLRQWDVLAGWLAAEREDLKDADVLERAAQAWERSGRREAWLMEGERLAIAEALAARRGFTRRLEGCREFLAASRRREDARRAEEEQHRQAELEAARRIAAEQEKRAEVEARARREAEASAQDLRAGRRRLRQVLGGTAVVAVVALGSALHAWQAQQRATAASLHANALRLAAQAQAMLSGARDEGDERALLQLLGGARTVAGAVDGELLDALIKRSRLRRLVSTGAPVYGLALSADGRRVVSVGDDLALHLWDAATGQPAGAWPTDHAKHVQAVAFSPDGSRLVSGSEDGTLQWRDAATGAPLGAPVQAHRIDVRRVAFSADGSRMASGGWGEDGTNLRLWEGRTGQPIELRFEGQQGAVRDVALSPDGSRVVAGNAELLLQMWDTTTGARVVEPMLLDSRVTSVAFSPDGRLIASGGDDGSLRLWDAAGWQPVAVRFAGHAQPVLSVAFSPDGRRLVSGGADRTLRVWDVETGRMLGPPLEGHTRAVCCVAFAKEGSRFASGSPDGTVRLWESVAARQALGKVLGRHKGPVRSVAFDRAGTRLASGGPDGVPRLWDVAAGTPLEVPFDKPGARIEKLAFSPDGHRVAAVDRYAKLRLWDVASGKPARPFEQGKDGVHGLAFSPDGRRIATGGRAGTLSLWNADAGQTVLGPLDGPKSTVSSLAFSHDGTRIATGHDDGSLVLWDAGGGRALRTLQPPYQGKTLGGVLDLAFSADCRRIAAVGGDNSLRLWDAVTGWPVLTLRGGPRAEDLERQVLSLAFSPDGRHIATGDFEGHLRLRDSATGQPLGAPLQGHADFLWSVAFSPDGRRIASGGEDGTVRLWPGPAAWPDELCAKLTRNMSRREWRDWVAPDIGYKCQCRGLPITPDEPGQPVAEVCTGAPAQPMFP